MFLPHPRVKVSIVGSLRDREVACSASDRQDSNFESCVWREVSSQSSHHPQEVLLAQFSLYVHKGGLKPDSFHFIGQFQEHLQGFIYVKLLYRLFQKKSACYDLCEDYCFWTFSDVGYILLSTFSLVQLPALLWIVMICTGHKAFRASRLSPCHQV